MLQMGISCTLATVFRLLLALCRNSRHLVLVVLGLHVIVERPRLTQVVHRLKLLPWIHNPLAWSKLAHKLVNVSQFHISPVPRHLGELRSHAHTLLYAIRHLGSCLAHLILGCGNWGATYGRTLPPRYGLHHPRLVADLVRG